MPGFSAYNCTNSTAKGLLTKTFPRDPPRRRIWTTKVRRANWQPTNYSVLCEVHFEEDMWETTRVDGKRKLKHNAVPTLFSFSSAPVHRKPAKDRASPVIPEPEGTAGEFQPPMQMEIQEPSTSFASVNQIESTVDTHSAESSLDETGKRDRKILQVKLQLYNRKYSFLLRSNKVDKNKLRNYNIKVKKQEKEIKSRRETSDQHCNTKLLQSVLKPDQINALKRKSTKGMKWWNAII